MSVRKTGIRKFLKWTAIVLAALVFGIPLLLVAINVVDEEMRPEVTAYADLASSDVPPAQNAFYAWIGIRAARNENHHARGLEIVEQVNKHLDIELNETEIIDIDSLLGPNYITSRTPTSELFSLCQRDTRDCLARYRAKDADIPRWVQEDQLLLDRYRALYSYAYFRETIKPKPTAPFYSAPATIAALARSQAAWMALHGNPDEALRRLNQDTAFWRRVLADSRVLVNRMIAAAVIQANARLVSEIVGTFRLPTDTLQIAAVAVRPLTDHEKDISEVFRYEFAFGIYMLSRIDSQSHHTSCDSDSWDMCLLEWLIAGSLLKPNATINLSFEKFNRVAQISKLSAPMFLEQAEKAREHDRDGLFVEWHFVYNPAGKILNSIAGDSLYYRYIGRMHNLDGFLRLTSLHVDIKRQNIRDDQIPDFLMKTGPNLRNPYTVEPMQWNATKKLIYFHGMGDKENEKLLSKRFEVQL